MITDDYIETIVRAAEGDASIARVLRDICALTGDVRAAALELVAAHLRTQAVAPDVLDCVRALREDGVARRIAGRLGPPAG